MRTLVVNAGSQSVKLSVITDGDATPVAEELGPPDSKLEQHLAGFLPEAGNVDVVGHRVVHGGSLFSQAVLVDDSVRGALETLTQLAPLHNPPALAGIDAARSLLPNVPTVACFDTAFHATLPPEASVYAVPQEWGVKRYGFHGLSCAWSTRRAAELLGRPVDHLRLIVCHLGGGASVTAVAGGRSVDTTMGYTPLEGLVMGTRSGDVDPGVLISVLRQGLTVDELDEALEHRSGLFGLSRRSADMRELLKLRNDGDEHARLAISVYLHRLRAKIAAMASSIQGADALVFTGGVGEHAVEIRAEACRSLQWLGAMLDPNANAATSREDRDISLPGAALRTLVIHAREDLQIARECGRIVAGRDGTFGPGGNGPTGG